MFGVFLAAGFGVCLQQKVKCKEPCKLRQSPALARGFVALPVFLAVVSFLLGARERALTTRLNRRSLSQ
jgi:hypothetical protein